MATETKTKEKSEKVLVEKSPTAKFDTTYMIIAIITVAVLLVVSVFSYFRITFVMYSPEKVVTQYMKNVAANDGYDAMKYTITIKNSKLGDFIKNNYMKKYLPEDEKVKAPELSSEEQGHKLTQTLDTMYPVFLDLVENYGFEDYDKLFTEYFAKYYEVHHEIYGHDIITADDMFAAFEGNVKTYSNEYAIICETSYGKGAQYADKYLGSGKTSLAEDDFYSAGYQVKINTEVVSNYTEQQVEDYRNAISQSADRTAYYEKYGITPDQIKEVNVIKATEVITGEGDSQTIKDKNNEFEEHARQITVVKIGSQWYVDITA